MPILCHQKKPQLRIPADLAFSLIIHASEHLKYIKTNNDNAHLRDVVARDVFDAKLRSPFLD
jgi:hypothetical protein